MNEINIIEENKPSQLAKQNFGEIVAKYLLEELGVDECLKLLEIYIKLEKKY